MTQAFILPIAALLTVANAAYALVNLLLLRGLQKLSRPGSPLSAPRSEYAPTVTVLIAARNEEGRVEKCLDCLLAQDYPPGKLQIIVVDDRSEDRTAAILEEYRARRPEMIVCVSITRSDPHISPKKFALSEGIQQATGEIILTTDADCLLPPSWISSMIREFTEDTGMVLGLTRYYAPPAGASRFLWGTQALEFFSYQVAAAALIGLDFPVLGNANNIAYRRKVYDLTEGFSSHGRIVSGDDDFLIQSIHSLGTWKIKYSLLPGARVETEPPLTLRQFWEQRKRWAGKTSLYRSKQVIFLGAIFAYYCSIPICLGLGWVHPLYLWLGFIGFGVKTTMEYMVMHKGARIFSMEKLLRFFPLAAILHIPLILAAVLAGSFGGFTWKGQTVKRKL